jgi:hypothetical protein
MDIAEQDAGEEESYDGPEIHQLDFIGQATGIPTEGFIDPLSGTLW